ncbi:MAG TPA: hypothetical protein VM512_09215 [Burkholderiaceae bacterium]|nr:hypothetical protein [Burkholderiaceae bacterium]
MHALACPREAACLAGCDKDLELADGDVHVWSGLSGKFDLVAYWMDMHACAMVAGMLQSGAAWQCPAIQDLFHPASPQSTVCLAGSDDRTQIFQ